MDVGELCVICSKVGEIVSWVATRICCFLLAYKQAVLF